MFEEMGVTFNLNCEIGKDISFQEIECQYNLIKNFLAVSDKYRYAINAKKKNYINV